MSGPIFICDAQGRPLMPLAAAHARKLLALGKAHRVPHHAFTIIQLHHAVDTPQLRPIVAGIAIHYQTAEIWIVAQGVRHPLPLLSLIVDLKTDIPRRLRRRAAHRRRRRSRLRYRSRPQHQRPFKLKRISLLHSSWGRTLRQRWHHRAKKWQLPPVIQWRVRAIFRVLNRLSRWLPISDVVLFGPLRSSADVRIWKEQNEVRYLAQRCAYCRSVTLRPELDHIRPRAQGGSDAWRNLVLTCSRCNARKGSLTPAEAQMQTQISSRQSVPVAKRGHPYVRQTARLLVHQLDVEGWSVDWLTLRASTPPGVSFEMMESLRACVAGSVSMHIFVTRLIGRPRKQVFAARNYPLSTPLSRGFEVKGRTVKRRLRVNRGLALWQAKQKHRMLVVQFGESIPSDADLFVTTGMVCEARRAGKRLIGIVAAIHSTGRLTILIPKHVQGNSITWDRVVISPRSHLRILSKDRVVFFPASSPSGYSPDPE